MKAEIIDMILNDTADVVREEVDCREFAHYIDGIDKNVVNGELLRSYFISYCDGIQKIWNRIVENTDEISELDVVVECEIEEALELADFDSIINEYLAEIKMIANI